MTDYRFVDLTSDDSLVAAVDNEARIGVDTEFVREKTFHAELCLVQVAAGEELFCADPMGLDAGNERDASVWAALARPAWVLHSGRQDLEVIYQSAGLLPKTVFDTQVAAALTGLQPQIGYANLVRELFDVELEKSHTRADWSRRPLPDAYMRYAAEDVEYLLPAWDSLCDKLDRLGRLAWAEEDSMALLDESLYAFDPGTAVKRLKGARNLHSNAWSAAAALATWREEEARRRNRPRQWILKDAVLLDIAVRRPTTQRELAAIEGLASRTAERAGDHLLRVLAESANQASDHQPARRPSEREKALLKKMQQCVQSAAESLGLASELVAARKDLSAAMLGSRDQRVFRGWRRQLIGEDLLEILEAG